MDEALQDAKQSYYNLKALGHTKSSMSTRQVNFSREYEDYLSVRSVSPSPTNFNSSEFAKTLAGVIQDTVTQAMGRDKPSTVRSPSPSLKCFKFGKSGHRQRDCRSSRAESYTPPGSPQVECYNCHKKGHYAKNCLQSRDKCFHCGKAGHFQNNCPDRSRDRTPSPYRKQTPPPTPLNG